MEVAALLLGALIHDFKHPGRSNAFLTKTAHSLSVTYNDVSVLENFHLSEVGPLRDRCGPFFPPSLLSIAGELSYAAAEALLKTKLLCKPQREGKRATVRQTEKVELSVVGSSLAVGVLAEGEGTCCEVGLDTLAAHAKSSSNRFSSRNDHSTSSDII